MGPRRRRVGQSFEAATLDSDQAHSKQQDMDMNSVDPDEDPVSDSLPTSSRIPCSKDGVGESNPIQSVDPTDFECRASQPVMYKIIVKSSNGNTQEINLIDTLDFDTPVSTRTSRTPKFIAPLGPFTCPICNRTFKRPTFYNTHMQNKHNQSNRASCDVCNKSFSSKAAVNLHNKTVHLKSSDYLCSVCGKAFPRKSYLQDHARMHSDAREFGCKFCDKTFRHQQGLSLHLTRHLKESQRQCPTCDLVLSNSASLKKHILAVHLKVRPYPCRLCNKQFKTSTHLKYHVSTHSNPNTKSRALNKESSVIKRSGKFKVSQVPGRGVSGVEKLIEDEDVMGFGYDVSDVIEIESLEGVVGEPYVIY